jgi:hypothetical protein
LCAGGTKGSHAADESYLRVLQSLNTLRESNVPKKLTHTAESMQKLSVLHSVDPTPLLAVSPDDTDPMAAIRLMKQYQLQCAVSEAAARPGEARLPVLTDRALQPSKRRDFSLVSALRTGTPARDVIKQSMEALEACTHISGKRATDTRQEDAPTSIESKPVSPLVAPLPMPPAKRINLGNRTDGMSPVHLTPSAAELGMQTERGSLTPPRALDGMLMLNVAASLVELRK